VKVLVTGGAGFIGSHIVDALLAEGHEARILDALLPLAHSRPPDYLDPAAELIVGDVGDADTVARALDGIDAVSHQAAMVGLGVDLADMPDYVRHNDLGTAVLLRALAARGLNGPLVLASSMVVYGEGRYRCAEHGEVTPPPRRVAELEAGRFEARCPTCDGPLEPEAIDELGRLDPRNVYAATKLHQEHLCSAAARESDLRVVALRYHNVYGPRMPRDTPYAGVASIFASSLAAGRSPRVYEDGGQLRDFVHVRDVARANLAALGAGGGDGDGDGVIAVNVASGQPRSILDMAQALSDAHGADAPRPQVTGDFRLGDVRHVFASAQRARAELGFTAQEDFADGMAEFARAPLRASS
jgi:dTDP-L-rhamnose 4-epimerase